ncbi:hypothetical protein Efla_004072 [Eimeria flavescens]
MWKKASACFCLLSVLTVASLFSPSPFALAGGLAAPEEDVLLQGETATSPADGSGAGGPAAGDVAIPLPPRPAAEVAQEEDETALQRGEDAEAAQGKKQPVNMEQLVARVFALGAAQKKYPPGTRTALLGLAAVVLFIMLNSVGRYLSSSEGGRMFNPDGSATIYGVSIIAAMTVFLSGLFEAVFSSRDPKHAGPLAQALANRGTIQYLVGKKFVVGSLLVVAAGFLLGFPSFVMLGAVIGFWQGLTAVILGLTLMFLEFKQGVDLFKQLYAPPASDVKPLKQKVPAEMLLLKRLADQLFHEQGEEKQLVQQATTHADAAAGEAGRDAAATPATPAADDLAALVIEQLHQGGIDLGGNHELRADLETLAARLANAVQELEENPEFTKQLLLMQQQMEKDGVLPFAFEEAAAAAAKLAAAGEEDVAQKELTPAAPEAEITPAGEQPVMTKKAATKDKAAAAAPVEGKLLLSPDGRPPLPATRRVRALGVSLL